MSELKPCPFCGGEAHIQHQYHKVGFDVLDWYGVYCVNPFCGHMCGHDTEAEAIAAWNTRAERTCEDANTRFNAWTCSECKCTLLLMFDDYGEPTLNVDGVASVPNYCPNCGAKVVKP